MKPVVTIPLNPLEPLTLLDMLEVTDQCVICDHKGTLKRDFYLMAVMLNARAKAALLENSKQEDTAPRETETT